MSFESIYRHGLRPRRGRGAARVQSAIRAPTPSGRWRSPARRRPRTPRSSSSPSSACRRTRAMTCSARTRSSTGDRGALERVIDASAALRPVIVVGAPLRSRAGAVQHRRRRSTAAGSSAPCPRATCPNTASSTRSASSARRGTCIADELRCSGERGPVRRRPRVRLRDDLPTSTVHVEICEDLWTPIPPSTYGGARRRHGARQPLGEQHHRRQGRLPPARSAPRSPRGRCRRISTPPPGCGESTTDLAWDGQALIYENGDLLAAVASASRPTTS